MFKIGDKVVCIDNNVENRLYKYKLCLYKVYDIEYIILPYDKKNIDNFYFIKIKNNPVKFRPFRFKLLTEVRKEKIKQLLNE